MTIPQTRAVDATSHFTHTALPSRVVFGRGTIGQVLEEAERLSVHRVLVLCSPNQKADAEQVLALLGDRGAGLHAEAEMHVPVAVARAGVARAKELGADAALAIGGGSSIGLGKAIALETSLPLLAVPTTYAGSEMTSVWGLTDENGKRTGRDARVLPASVVYDIDLTLGLPLEMSVTSAVNALAHSIEAVYAPDRSPLIDLTATQSAQSLLGGIECLGADPDDVDARAQLLYGAWLAGSCLGATTMSLHHKLCHIIGGSFNLSHAWTHTLVLPHVMAYNLRPGTPTRALVSAAFGHDDPATHLWQTLTDLGWGRTLADLGMPSDGVEQVVSTALASPYANPYQPGADDIRAIVTDAYTGKPPRSW